VERALRDLRLAARSWRRSPALAAAAVVTLALGLGANTALFSLVDAVLLRPLPGIAEPGRLVNVHRSVQTASTPLGFSHPDYRDLRERARALSGLAAFNGRGVSFGDGPGPAEMVGLQLVSGNFFEVLGVRPLRGRMLGPADDAAPGVAPVAVVSHALWQRRLGGDEDVVGRTVRLNGFPFTVVGVAPEGFQGHFVGFPFEVFVPLAMAAQAAPGDSLTDRDEPWLELVGRLAPEATIAQAQADLDAVAGALAREHGTGSRRVGAQVTPATGIDDELRGPVVSFLAGLQALALLVLVVACVNVAGLLLARAAARARDVAVRTALGASRAAIAREAAAETLMLFAVGGAAGVALAHWSADLLHTLQPRFPVPLRFDLGVSGRVLAFAAGVTAVAGATFAAFAAVQAGRLGSSSALREGRGGEPRGRARLRASLVVTQVALSMVLLVVAGLFMRSVQNARHVDVGFDPAGVVTARLDLRLLARGENETRALQDALLERLAALPGAEGAAFASWIPLRSLAPPTELVRAEGAAEDEGLGTPVIAVSPAYLQVMRIPLREGRAFAVTDGPDSARVVLVSESLARRLWPEGGAVGRAVRHGDVTSRVVGVVADVKTRRVTETAMPLLYVSLAQEFSPFGRALLRRQGPPAEAMAALAREVAALDRDLPVMEPMPLREAIAFALFPQRIAGAIASGLGALALLLAATGLYGLVAWSAGRRTREMGVRVALGATRGQVMALVLRHGLGLAAAGVALGAAGAGAAAHALRSLLPGVSAADPLTFAAIAALMASAAAAASFGPARRAARVDPAVALRSE
jgi:predicted permease